MKFKPLNILFPCPLPGTFCLSRNQTGIKPVPPLILPTTLTGKQNTQMRKCHLYPSWGKRVVMCQCLLASISASSPWTDLKSIQNPHCLFRDFTADKIITTCWAGSRVQVWAQAQAPDCHLATTSEVYSKRHLQRLWLQNQKPISWGSIHIQLGLVWSASIKTGFFWTDCSLSWQAVTATWTL